MTHTVPRLLQQQPRPLFAREQQQQQQSGSTDFQPPKAQPREQQMGEGSYDATRDYQDNIKSYLKKADVPADARAAHPHNEQEARELEAAEKEGKSHTKAPGE
jgi:hypothetical protein